MSPQKQWLLQDQEGLQVGLPVNLSLLLACSDHQIAETHMFFSNHADSCEVQHKSQRMSLQCASAFAAKRIQTSKMVAAASLSSSVNAGDVEKDFWYALDLLRSPKDHVEFTLVRDFVRDALLEVCSQVKLDTEKSVLKQAAVQHLYGRLSGTLKSSANDAQLLVSHGCQKL